LPKFIENFNESLVGQRFYSDERMNVDARGSKIFTEGDFVFVGSLENIAEGLRLIEENWRGDGWDKYATLLESGNWLGKK